MTSTSTIPQSGNKKKKSVLLSPDEMKKLKKYRKPFHTDVDFAADMGIGRATILRVLLLGSGSEATIKKVREKLSTVSELENAE